MLQTPHGEAAEAASLHTPHTPNVPVTTSDAQTAAGGGIASVAEPEPQQRAASGRRRLAMPRGGLWSNADFMRLWIGESISAVGSQITAMALPLLAALTLDASPGQMGVLAALETLPALLFGLLAGAWVDRLRRKPVLVVTNLLRCVFLGTIPLAWALDMLTIGLLFVVGFLSGIASLFFTVAYMSFVPTLVRTDQLVDANSRLEGSASTAQAAGPGAAGLLIAVIGAPLALLVDALSYLWSTWWLLRIRVTERVIPSAERSNVLTDIREGLSVVVQTPMLRTIALFGAVNTFFGWVFLAVYVLYMTQDLHFGATAVGFVFSMGGVGAVIGAVLSVPVRRRLGVGPSIVAGRLLFGLLGLLVPLAMLIPRAEVPLVVLAEFVQWMVFIIAIVNELSVRQTLAPPAALGRVNASFRTFVGGMTPLGALFGGWLGGVIGLRETLVVGCIGMLVAGFIALASPLRTMRDLPEMSSESEGAESAA